MRYHWKADPISLATTFGISVDVFSSSYLDVSVRLVRLCFLCIQKQIPCSGGFPHSEISGSKFICQLTGAYRRLSRPSSPIIAKASTTCSYSLDPITLTSIKVHQALSDIRLTHFAKPNLNWVRCNQMIVDALASTMLIRLYELLKNSLGFKSQFQNNLSNCFGISSYRSWWRMTGSNRRPPACKAGALPAELIPPFIRVVVGLVGLEPTTPALSRRCSNQLSYRPELHIGRRQLPSNNR